MMDTDHIKFPRGLGKTQHMARVVAHLGSKAGGRSASVHRGAHPQNLASWTPEQGFTWSDRPWDTAKIPEEKLDVVLDALQAEGHAGLRGIIYPVSERAEATAPPAGSPALPTCGRILERWYEGSAYGDHIPKELGSLIASFVADASPCTEEKAWDIVMESPSDSSWWNLFECVFKAGVKFTMLELEDCDLLRNEPKAH